MATTIFDGLSMQLSRRLDDPASWTAGNAGTDGKKFSNTSRQDLLNRANADIQFFIFRRDPTPTKAEIRRLLEPLIASQSISAFASAGVAVAADYNLIPLYLTASSAVYIFHPLKEDLDTNLIPEFHKLFTIEGSKIYAYAAGAILATGTGTFYYIKKDQVTQNSATDIVMPSTFHPRLVDLATIYGRREWGLEVKMTIGEFWDEFDTYLKRLGA